MSRGVFSDSEVPGKNQHVAVWEWECAHVEKLLTQEYHHTLEKGEFNKADGKV